MAGAVSTAAAWSAPEATALRPASRSHRRTGCQARAAPHTPSRRRPAKRRSPYRTACRPGSRLHTLGSASVPSSACPKATTPAGGRASARTHERWARNRVVGHRQPASPDSHIQNHARPSEAWFEVLRRSRRSVLAPKGAFLVVTMPTDQRLPRLRRSQLARNHSFCRGLRSLPRQDTAPPMGLPQPLVSRARP